MLGWQIWLGWSVKGTVWNPIHQDIFDLSGLNIYKYLYHSKTSEFTFEPQTRSPNYFQQQHPGQSSGHGLIWADGQFGSWELVDNSFGGWKWSGQVVHSASIQGQDDNVWLRCTSSLYGLGQSPLFRRDRPSDCWPCPNFPFSLGPLRCVAVFHGANCL